MAENNGSSSHLDRLEKLAADLLEHARLGDLQIDIHTRQIEALRTSQLETAASVQSLGGAIRELIDRILLRTFGNGASLASGFSLMCNITSVT